MGLGPNKEIEARWGEMLVDRQRRKEAASQGQIADRGVRSAFGRETSSLLEAPETPAASSSAPPPDEVPSGKDTSADTAATPAAAAEGKDPRGEASGRVEAAGAESASSAQRERRAAGKTSYRVLQISGQLTARQREIVDVLLAQPWRGWTRQELARDSGVAMIEVSGLVDGLIAEPLAVLVELPEKKRCSVTGDDLNAIVLAKAI